jgi:GDPmannose 4,6-dehydratase
VNVFTKLGIILAFKGEGPDEFGEVVGLLNPDVKVSKGDVLVRVDSKYFRPTEVDLLIGDPTKAQRQLGWQLNYDLNALVDDMVQADLELFKRDRYLSEGGHRIFQHHE